VWLLGLLGAALWLLLAPPTPDLATQVYRSNLFGRVGFALWDPSWYGGHHIPGYSVLFPALGSLIGPRPVGAIAAVVSVVLAERILAASFSPKAARLAAIWVAVALIGDLLIGRLTYSLGVTVGLGAVLALQRGHPCVAALLGLGCAATSPVAAVFVALAGAAIVLSGGDRRALGVAVTSLGTVVVLAVLFPEGGVQPYRFFQPIVPLLACAGVLALTESRDRTLRVGTVLYVLGCLVTIAIPSPVGDNVLRLGALLGGPLVVALWIDRPARRRNVPLWVVVVATVGFASWQLAGPIREVVKGSGDPSTHAPYYTPVIGFLRTHAGPATRIEVPFTQGHWEAAFLAPHVALARGWETQLDEKYGALFYQQRGAGFTPERYHAWLRENAVRYVVLPDAALDPTSEREGAVIRSRPSWLVPVWSSAHWQVFRVRDTLPLVSGPARLVALRPDGFTLRAAAAGDVLLRVRPTPYLDVRGPACITPGGDGWTHLRVAAPGRLVVRAKFALDDVVDPASPCPAPPG
jgi:hypothetical protein